MRYICTCDVYDVCRRWLSLAEEAMAALYHTNPCPDRIAGTVISYLYTRFSTPTADAAGPEHTKLSRLLFLLGQSALCTLAYTERVAALSKKVTDSGPRSNATDLTSTSTTQNNTIKGKGSKQGKGQSKGSSHQAGAAGVSEQERSDGDDADLMEEEMGLAASADADHEMVSRVCIYVACLKMCVIYATLNVHILLIPYTLLYTILIILFILYAYIAM